MISLEVLKRSPVFFYTAVPIAPYGQGSSIRVYGNIRAYLDLGFRVEIIQFVTKDGNSHSVNALFPDIRSYSIKYLPEKPGLLQRQALYTGYPQSAVLDILYPIRRAGIKEVKKNEQLNPNAIHHFEDDNLASAVFAFKQFKSIWSNHDISSWRIPLLWDMRREYSLLSMSDSYRFFQLKRVRFSEDALAGKVNLILNIAKHEHEEFFQQRNYNHAELLPMSWPDEERVIRKHGWMDDGYLRLLHLGSVDGFVGYDSLRFVLENVFPILQADNLKYIKLVIVGKINNTKYSQHILELAKPYPQVEFLGYVEDIKTIYSTVDMQIVGNLRASGLRTRIVESFVYGLPVLSTIESAKGLIGLSDGVNILLADDPQAYARQIINIMANPERLQFLADNARKTYDNQYSRNIASNALGTYLEKHL